MVVWTSIGAAFLFIEMHGAGPELPWWRALKTRFAPRPKFHVVPKMHSSRSAETDDVYTSIDPILDKISKFGIGSLTASERRQLDRERERLLKNRVIVSATNTQPKVEVRLLDWSGSKVHAFAHLLGLPLSQARPQLISHKTWSRSWCAS